MSPALAPAIELGRYAIAVSPSDDVRAASSPVGTWDAPVTVRLLPPSEAPAALRVWRELEARLAPGWLTCSADWTETWLEHYGRLVPHRFAVGEREGQPCALALVTEGVGQRRGPIPIRTLHLGTAGEPPRNGVYVEYNRLLVAAEDRPAFAVALVEAIRRDPRWNEFVLDGFAPEDAEALLRAEPGLVARQEACPVVDLRAVAAAGGDVIASLKPGTRQKVRRSLRGFGPVRGEWAETPEQALNILEELIMLHQRRWARAGQPGAFASPYFAGFHRALVPRLVPSQAVILFRVRAEAGTIGCVYCLVEQGRVLSYQSGLAYFDDRKLRPGFTVDALCMQACLERGLAEYNFLAGDSQYKQEMATAERTLVWAVARRPGLKLALVDGLRAARRWVRGRLGRGAPGRAREQGPNTAPPAPADSSGDVQA